MEKKTLTRVDLELIKRVMYEFEDALDNLLKIIYDELENHNLIEHGKEENL